MTLGLGAGVPGAAASFSWSQPLFRGEGSFCPRRPVSLQDPLPPGPPLNSGASQLQRGFSVACPHPPVASAPYQNKEPHRDTAQPREMHKYTYTTCHVASLCWGALGPLPRSPEVSDTQVKKSQVSYSSLEFQTLFSR